MGISAFCRSYGPGVLATALVICSGSCSLLIDGDRQQCSTTLDCQTAAGGATRAVCIDQACVPDPTWSCLGAVSWPPATPGLATVTFHFQDLISEQPTQGVTARVCNKLDLNCEAPLAADLRGDETGTLSVQLPTGSNGFEGYIEVTARDRLPGLYFFYPPVTSDRDIPNVPLIRSAELTMFVSVAGRSVLPGRGHVMLGAYDCQGKPAQGVQVRSEGADAQSSPFYLVQKLPSLSATATDGSGRGGLINMMSGPVPVSGLTPNNERFGNIGVFVRTGSITYTTLRPGPQ